MKTSIKQNKMENETEYKSKYEDLTEHSYPNDRKDGKNQQRDTVL